VFYGLPVRESQIEQVALDRVIVRVAPASGYTADRIQRTISRRLQDRLGDVAIEFDEVAVIPRTANGKLRSIICRVPGAEVA
jgi:phenylacetate-CoA ligase